MEHTSTFNCPTCKRAVSLAATNPWRPFCSQRCKLIDLGAWATEKHVLPDDTNDSETLPIDDPTNDS